MPVPGNNFAQFLERFRFIPSDNFLPIIILPLMLLTATINIWWGTITLISMIVILLHLHRFCLEIAPMTKFFFIWTFTSVAVIFAVFQLFAIPYLEITGIEVIVSEILIVAAIFFLCFTISINPCSLHNSNKGLLGVGDSQDFNRFTYCPICRAFVPEQDMHCIWLNCCIGIHNRMAFLTFTILANAALLYTAIIIFSLVCYNNSSTFSIFIPNNNCSSVYDDIRSSGPFVVAVYNLTVSLFLIYYMFHFILLTSIGMTGKEFRELPLSSKLRLGIGVSKPNNFGFFQNWKRMLCSFFQRERASRS